VSQVEPGQVSSNAATSAVEYRSRWESERAMARVSSAQAAGAVACRSAYASQKRSEIHTSDGTEYDGFSNHADLTHTPVDRGTPPSDQTITLDLEVGVGEVVISHA